MRQFLLMTKFNKNYTVYLNINVIHEQIRQFVLKTKNNIIS